MPGSAPVVATMSRRVSTLAPDQRGVVERVADRRRRRQQLAQPHAGVGVERRQGEPDSLALVRRERGVASRAGEHAEAAAARRARAGHRQRLGQLEQLVHVLRPGRASLLDERAEHALVAGHGPRVRRRGHGAGGGGAHLEHSDSHAPLGAARQRLAEQLAVAVGLEVERDRPDLVLLRQRGDPAGGIEAHGVAAGDDRVQAQAAPGGQCVDRDVAALRDERDPPRLERAQRVAPERDAVANRDDPVPVGAADGQAVQRGRRLQLPLQLGAVGDLAEPCAVDDRAPAAGGAGLLHRGGHARGRDGDDHRVGGLGQVGQRREARHAVRLGAPRVDPPDRAGVAQPPQVEQRLPGVRPVPVGRADDRDRARVEQARQVH